ncbi:MAG: hypothetical protein AB3P11_05895 [Wolbachia pipientis]
MTFFPLFSICSLYSGNWYNKTRKYEYIDLDDKETREKLLSANSTNAKGENGYRGKYLKGKIVEEIEKEMSENLKNNSIKSIKLLVGRKPGKPELTARIVVSNYTIPININDLLVGEMCEKYNVKAVTLLLLDQEEKRGIRCRVDENGTRIYEVANGLYNMELSWEVEGKKCEMKISISDNGSVEFIEGNDVTWDQIAAHKEVKVGRQYEAKPLYEALSYLKREGSEIIKGSYPPTSVEDIQIATGVNRQVAI